MLVLSATAVLLYAVCILLYSYVCMIPGILRSVYFILELHLHKLWRCVWETGWVSYSRRAELGIDTAVPGAVEELLRNPCGGTQGVVIP